MQNLFHGDFGLSLEYQRPNADLIGEQLGLTIALALFSFVLTWAIAVPAGIYSATHPRSLGDHVLTVINYVGVATPNFMLALILMWVAFAYFDISVTGLYSPEFVDAPWSVGRVVDLLGHIWLPALVLGIAGTARLSRIMRANLLDELNKPYVVTARAKGMKEWRLVLRYPVRLAFNPLVSTIGWYLPPLFSGSLIVATVMNLPNIGPLLLRALVNQDMYLAGGILLIYSLPHHRRHAAVRRPAGADRSAHPGGELEWPTVDRGEPGGRGPRRRRLQLAAGVVALPPPSPGDGERRAADLPLPDRPGARISSRPRTPSAPTRARPSFRCRWCIFFDDGRLAPWVPAIVGKRNPDTLRMEWTTDPQKKVPVRFFAPGHS